MKNRKVIAARNLPMRSPAVSTVMFWLLLDKINAPGWAWGVVGTLMAIVWIGFAVDLWKREPVEIFPN